MVKLLTGAFPLRVAAKLFRKLVEHREQRVAFQRCVRKPNMIDVRDFGMRAILKHAYEFRLAYATRLHSPSINL